MYYIKKILKIVNNITYSIAINAIIFFDNFKPLTRTIKYNGFIVYYSKGTSIIETNGFPPVRYGGIYEKYESRIIVNHLKQYKNPFFVDIGANIGLISLNVLAEIPDCKIFCFEPGSHQHSLFQRTIEANNLNNINLYPFAIGEKTGKFQFAAHTSEHSSGDGFFDTNRAGKSQIINIPVITLDHWWVSRGKPKIRVIKIDVEGAELWVLKGALQCIESTRPLILIEINEINLKSYPYNHEEILSFFKMRNYALTTLEGISISNSTQLYNDMQIRDSFVASPLN